MAALFLPADGSSKCFEYVVIRVTCVAKQLEVQQLEDGPMPLIRQISLRGAIDIRESVEDQSMDLEGML